MSPGSRAHVVLQHGVAYKVKSDVLATEEQRNPRTRELDWCACLKGRVGDHAGRSEVPRSAGEVIHEDS